MPARTVRVLTVALVGALTMQASAGIGPLSSDLRGPDPQAPMRWNAYEQLDQALCRADQQRIAGLIQKLDAPFKGVPRDEYTADSVEQYPTSVKFSPAPAGQVPLFILPDPEAVYKALGNDAGHSRYKLMHSAAVPNVPPAGSMLAYFAKQAFETPCSSPPWPPWADQPVSGRRYPVPASLRWGYTNSTGLVFNNSGRACLEDRNKARITALRWERAVTDSIWCLLPDSNLPYREIFESLVSLVFPLWESVGTLRDPTLDPFEADRLSPMSAHVESPDLDWKLGGYSAFTLGAPIPWGKDGSRRREYLAIPELLASKPIPMVSIYKAETWKPFAEDYVIRVGPPTQTEGLRAVCVFMTATDEQLTDVLRFFTDPPIPKGAPPETR